MKDQRNTKSQLMTELDGLNAELGCLCKKKVSSIQEYQQQRKHFFPNNTDTKELFKNSIVRMQSED